MVHNTGKPRGIDLEERSSDTFVVGDVPRGGSAKLCGGFLDPGDGDESGHVPSRLGLFRAVLGPAASVSCRCGEDVCFCRTGDRACLHRRGP